MSKARLRSLRLIQWGVVCCLAAGCGERIAPCGSVSSFTGARIPNGQLVDMSFTFDPSRCGSDCTCNTICYIQVARFLDVRTGQFWAPNSEQVDRMVTGRSDARLNGWAVDRFASLRYGYFGREDSGDFTHPEALGSNIAPALFEDSPRLVTHVHSRFEAITVPVCIDESSSCRDRLLGYHYWLFNVDRDTSSALIHQDAVDWQRTAFDLAIAAWNDHADALHKIRFPAMSSLR